MPIVCTTLLAALLTAVSAFAQPASTPLQTQQPSAASPQQPAPAAPQPTAPGAPQTPAPSGGAPPVVPAPTAAAAPLAGRTFLGEAGMIINAVRPDRTVDFELVIGFLQAAFEKSTNPQVRAQAKGWRFFKGVEPGPNGAVLYVFWIDPAVMDADYALGPILSDAFPDQVEQIWKLYQGAIAGTGSQTLLNLASVKPPELPPPGTPITSTPTPARPGPPPAAETTPSTAPPATPPGTAPSVPATPQGTGP